MSNNATFKDIQAVLNSEHSQVAAVFDSQAEADSSAQTVRESGIAPEQITLIRPLDSHFSDKLEQNSKKIGKSLWRSHLQLGLAGLVVGLIVAWLLVMFGPELTRNNPMFTFIALISPGLFIGLFVAGLLGLRPDRDKIIQTVRSATKRKKYTLVVNLQKGQSFSKVSELLRANSNTVIGATR